MQQRKGISILGYGCMRFTKSGTGIDFDKNRETEESVVAVNQNEKEAGQEPAEPGNAK